MSITSVGYDWGVDPTIIRMTTTSALATITASGFWALPATVAALESVNNGALDVPEGTLWLINYSNGEGFFTLNTSTDAFVAETVPGALSETLPDADIFVGNAANIATGVTPSGDITLTNAGVFGIASGVIVNADVNASAAIDYSKLATLTSGNILVGSVGNVPTSVAMSGDVAIVASGATTIQAGAVDKAMLAATVRPSHMIVFSDQLTTVGGAAAEAFTVTGAVGATDTAFVQMVNQGTGVVTALIAVVTNDTLTVTFSANPQNDAVFNYQIVRATS